MPKKIVPIANSRKEWDLGRGQIEDLHESLRFVLEVSVYARVEVVGGDLNNSSISNERFVSNNNLERVGRLLDRNINSDRVGAHALHRRRKRELLLE